MALLKTVEDDNDLASLAGVWLPRCFNDNKSVADKDAGATPTHMPLIQLLVISSRTMKSRVFQSLIWAVIFYCTGHSADKPQPYYPATKQPPLSRAGLGALEHASKLVAAINALDWKTAEDALPPTNKFFPFVRGDVEQLKDWHGIGAYRGSDYYKEDQTLVHRFGYGPGRSHPHEAWFHYSLDGDKFTFIGISILGW